jgi:hypothetical protein
MKKLFPLFIMVMALVFAQSCKKDSTSDNNTLAGDPSPMGSVGTTVSSSSASISGVSDLQGSVVSVSDGVSSYSGTGIITNSAIKNIIANLPGITIKGDTVTATGYQIKQTTEGIESFIGTGPGVVVKYASNVGDTYEVGSTGRVRTVVNKSTDDDYSYGFMLIKVIQVEEPTPALKSVGVTKITYTANHKFGLVGVKYDFTDGSSINLPIYCSTQNGK